MACAAVMLCKHAHWPLDWLVVHVCMSAQCPTIALLTIILSRQEHERVLSLVPPVTRSLLRPHLEDVDNKIQPGAVILTWASMNIDGYLHHIHQVNAHTSL